MPEQTPLCEVDPNPEQASGLAILVELEALWENLRHRPSRTPAVPATVQNLHGIQKAYEAFRVKLGRYNSLYAPGHVPELLLNTPERLGTWCRRMRDLFLRVEKDPQVRCPVHLLEKAYGWADKVAAKMNKDRVARPTAPETIRAAIQELDALGQWCDDLVRLVPEERRP